MLEVVFVALPGYLVAWTGMFDANSQKFVAELNTMVFTPCLIFTKLASQLNADKLSDLVVIPIIFIAQTLVSWLSAQAMSRVFGFGKKHKQRQKNFVIAMGVFGNSNSLPISLVLSPCPKRSVGCTGTKFLGTMTTRSRREASYTSWSSNS